MNRNGETVVKEISMQDWFDEGENESGNEGVSL